MNRRDFLKAVGLTAGTITLAGSVANASAEVKNDTPSLQYKITRPNILFLMSDQHRWDCLAAAGNSKIKTPNLDSIAQNGVLFSNAYASTPTCTPCRSVLLTGLSPWHHGMLGYGRVAEKYPFELPGAMKNAGYHTFGIGKMHWYPQKTLHGFHGTLVDESGRVETEGFISDYRRWFAETAPEQNPDATGIGFNDYRASAYALDEKLHPTFWTGNTACQFIDTYNKPEPFFLKVSFARPHSPYDPPQRFWNMYDATDMPAPFIGDWADRYTPYNDTGNKSWRCDRGVETAQISRKGYYANITFIDEQVGNIIKTLKKKGLYDNTLIIFTADHGDMLGDHHLWRKSYAYEGSTHIPMLMKWPKHFKTVINRGSIVKKPVEMRDILPTCLDAANAAIPPKLDGQSLLDLIRNANPQWREYIDLEHSTCYHDINHWMGLTDGKYKYIFHASDEFEQLFNLQNDKEERVDLAQVPANTALLTRWRNRLIEHLSERGTEYVKNGQLVVWNSEDKLYSPFYDNKFDPR